MAERSPEIFRLSLPLKRSSCAHVFNQDRLPLLADQLQHALAQDDLGAAFSDLADHGIEPRFAAPPRRARQTA